MAYIFLDESGDLGFNFDKARTTKFFVITAIFTIRKNPIEKAISKTRKILFNSQPAKHSGVLHANHESPKIRTRALSLIAEKDIGILSIYLNKQRVYTKLREEKSILYNYVANILLDRVCRKKLLPTDEPIILIASRRETNKFLNENFKQYLYNQTILKHSLRISVEIKSTREESGLQAADFVSWAIFRKYEYGDDSYYNLIKRRIVEENPLFP